MSPEMSPEMSLESLVCCVQHTIYLKSIPSARLLYEIERKIANISNKKTLKEPIVTCDLCLF